MRLLNTIYVTSEDAWLRRDRENIVIEIDGAEKGRMPLHMLEGLVCFNRAGVSPGAMAACAERGIALSFLQPNGRFLARVEGSAAATCCCAARNTGLPMIRRALYQWCVASWRARRPTSAP
jgi:CRISPR/Cas system-associated endonuclease Cas1